jgi:hypothetical protein
MICGLRIASLAVALLALAGCAARVHTPFASDYEPEEPTLVRAASSQFDVLDHTPRPFYATAPKMRPFGSKRWRSLRSARTGKPAIW